MNPVSILTNEHRLIRQYLDNLAFAIQRMERGERPPKQFFENAVLFARDFVDGYHHFKEEHQMFVLLAQKKGGELDAQIEALRYQHERGRSFVGQIADALFEYDSGSEQKATAILENLAAYCALLRQHIHREDHVFYPLAVELLDVGEKARLVEQFGQADEKAGPDFFEKSAEQVDKMAGLASE